AAALEAKRGDLLLAEERLNGLRSRRNSLKQRADNNAAEAARLEATTAPVEPDRSVSQAEMRAAELADQVRAAAAALAASRTELRAAASGLEARRQRSHEHERAMAAYESRLAALREQQTSLQERLDRGHGAVDSEDPDALEGEHEESGGASCREGVRKGRGAGTGTKSKER